MRARRSHLLLLALVLSTPLHLPAQTTPAADSLVGLWGAEMRFGPEISGPLTITRATGRWRASVGGFTADAGVRGDSIGFSIRDGKGDFRGRMDAGAIRGFWIQPATVEGGVRYATPVVLRPAGAGTWRGTVAPLEDAYALYLTIQRRPGDTLVATFRNPQRNHRGPGSGLRVEQAGDSIRFIPPAEPGDALAAYFDRARRQIVLPWAQLGRTVTLRPMSPQQATGFFPRPPGSPPYVYRAPTAEDDGWRTARASQVGMDEAALARLVAQIIAVDPSERLAPLVHSVLVARHGRLVLEEYFAGHDREHLHDLRSGGKTFASVLAGAARLHGTRLELDAPIAPAFARYQPFANPDPRKGRITLRNLMTMSSGLACDENDENSPGNEDRMGSQTAQPDWYRFTLDLPMARDPGELYAYCSGTVNLIGGVIGSATRTWLPELFDRLLARPLQIRRYAANLTPTGDLYFGGGMRMRPRDFMKFGQAYLDGGVWNGRRIVSRAWVDESTRRQIGDPASGDGLNWHRATLTAGGRTWREYEANGNGGQFLIVLPELDVVVVYTAANYGGYLVWRRFRDEWLPQFIIPAATGV